MRLLLSDIFDPQSIVLNLEGKTKEAIFDELAGKIAAVHPECEKKAMLTALWERENKMSTGIVSGFAIPHASYRNISNVAGAIGVSQEGIEYGSLDQKPVHVVLMLIMSQHSMENHLHILNQIVRLTKSEALELIIKARSTEEISSIFNRFR